MIQEFIHRVRRKLEKLRLRPIRVFCFHQVSDTFDENTMYHEDWLQTEDFKGEVLKLTNQGYTFISLPEAYQKLKHDIFRFYKYAVLTADDGDASLLNVLPWLNEQKIPVTLFLNPMYIDGKHFRNRNTERYLSEADLKQFSDIFPLLSIGSHGWVHVDSYKQTEQEFKESIIRSDEYLKSFPNYIPFFAYPYGRCTYSAYKETIKQKVVPVLVRGNKNIKYDGYIDRELFKSTNEI